MLHDFHALLAPALMERLTLLLNHVLAAEAVATARLVPHAGRRVRVELQSWPGWLPPAPRLVFLITPAGLLDWMAASSDAEQAADLTVRVQASNPVNLAMRAMSREALPVEIDGDAQLAADVDWLIKNLRWDMAADLERAFGPVLAHQLHGLGAGLAQGVKSALQGAGALAERWRAR